MKKVKLFTTIASLCLAVALMAFGVYATTSASFSVGGSISFSATDVTGSWTWKVEIDEASTATANFATGVTAAGSFETFEGVQNAENINVEVTKAGTVILKITVEFTNTSSKAGTLSAAVATEENCTVDAGENGTWTKNGDTATVVSTVSYECQADTDLTATYKVTYTAQA